jgi:hypothetical protein
MQELKTRVRDEMSALLPAIQRPVTQWVQKGSEKRLKKSRKSFVRNNPQNIPLQKALHAVYQDEC